MNQPLDDSALHAPESPESQLRVKLGALVAAAASEATGSGRALSSLRGIAVYDGQKDEFVRSLGPFAQFAIGLPGLTLFPKHYGAGMEERIALQLVYEYFARATDVSADLMLLDSLWADFLAELSSPVWVTRTVTNLRLFQCDTAGVILGDGVSIIGRDPDALMAMGFSDRIVGELFAEWGGFGASSFVMVAEVSTPKNPHNVLRVDGGECSLRCARAIGALRLTAQGDVGMCKVFVHRIARFNVGIGGMQFAGNTLDPIGTAYIWDPQNRPAFGTLYASLARLESVGYAKSPGNLDLALRSFMATFDRFPASADMKLMDTVTALEAVLGTRTEITFRLSFRVASLLAGSDDERSTILEVMKTFYDARSRVVHGDHLEAKHSAALAAVDDLRDFLRRLLRAFVLLAADDTRPFAKKSFERDLDATLVSEVGREGVRVFLELTNH